jgi:aminoglycoside phosphotransferase (APT) family kinase protein
MSEPVPTALFAAGLVDVRPGHSFDETRFAEFLRDRLAGFAGNLVVKQFEGGQSNPTFLLASGDRRWVLRKKPPGKLLPTAHAIEREHRILSALQGTGVPVPKVALTSDDEALIGTPFFVMEFVPGRVFHDPTLPGVAPADRTAMYDDMNRVLAALHGVDYTARGLADYGKPGNYFVRQTGRWTQQYAAAKTHDIPSMDALVEWLPAHIPDDDTTTIVHGDFQISNLLFHPTEPRVVALLDWELSTLGHPMADLAYSCHRYHVTPGGLAGNGIPTEEAYVARYCERTGRPRIPNWNFYLAFSLFRLASIVQGVYKRGLQGNASSSSAVGLKLVVDAFADKAWELARTSS